VRCRVYRATGSRVHGGVVMRFDTGYGVNPMAGASLFGGFTF
jgi:hypothetical protein